MYNIINRSEKTQRRELVKIRLNVSDERYSEIEQKLLSAGFEIDDEAELIITEKEHYSSFIAIKNKKGE